MSLPTFICSLSLSLQTELNFISISKMKNLEVYDGNNNENSSTDLSPKLFYNPNPSPTDNHSDEIDFASFYPSIFPPYSNSLPITPSDCSFDDANNAITTVNRLHEARFMLECQQLYNRYTMCLAYLQESLKDFDALSEENDNLRITNADLIKRLSLLSHATIQNCLLSSGHQPPSFINDFDRLSVRGTLPDSHVSELVSDISPTSVIEQNRFDRRNVERVTLPKSISVRSSGYLKTTQRGGGNSGPSRRNRVKSQNPNGSQRVYVPGGKRAAAALEFEVYNQGMFKMELCNKWQRTGQCPYGDNCQFAHGITELRPVIRQPRYKTEICRTVLAGDECPYGHRCHFRHTLTEAERLLGPTSIE
ncbi:zinc finger CCCH domain-containing protein 14-like isoform X2 [Actinidia eriantha]|uniref:zinc finger CCCH domain-containing protein 14-like isoform X2 n=1 Tax=Actinidia eriantha TaxID=165200 RepID=UPI00258E9A25|nr:zinc finger CCCH domain-containing protein 14-like isoform X2 [Actinidia eriantha]